MKVSPIIVSSWFSQISYRKLTILIFSLIVIFSLIGFFPFLSLLLEPTSEPLNVFISNTTDSQATVSWITTKATKGVVLISEDGKFPVLPIFTNQLYKDDVEKRLKKQSFHTTHHVTITNLRSPKNYHIGIYQGLKRVYQGRFTTVALLDYLSSPIPVYGKVLSTNKTPIVGAIIYFRAKEGNLYSSVLSTTTNTQGRWIVDLANLRSQSLKEPFKITDKTYEEVVVEAGVRGRGKATTTFSQDNPWPDIILK